MYEYEGVVDRVIDGDTVDVLIDLGFKIKHKIRLRFVDIDTPEIFRPSCTAELEHGREAKAFVEKELLGREITVATHKDKTGKYGRYLADIMYQHDDSLTNLFIVDELFKNEFNKRADYMMDKKTVAHHSV